MRDVNADIEHAILELVSQRGVGKTICPSDAARLVDPENWRTHLKQVRRVAVDLSLEGKIAIYRKGKPIDPKTMKGVIRLGLPPED